MTAPDPSPFERRSKRDRGPKDRSHLSFWRACRYLYPYRRIVLVSIGCAFFVGASFTAGLTSMLPMMQVLLNGQTVQSWADREIGAHRLGVTLSDESGALQVVKVNPKGAAAKAGLEPGQQVAAVGSIDGGDFGSLGGALADPNFESLDLKLRPGGQRITVQVGRLPIYLALGHRLAGRMPRDPVLAIALVFGLVALLAIVSNVVKFFQEYLSDKAAIMSVQDIRKRTYDHVLHVPLSHFGTRGTSDVTSRLTQDAQELAQGFKTILGQTIQEPIKAFFAFGLALLVSWKLTLFIVIFAPVVLVIIKKLGKKMRRASHKAMVNSSSMLGQIEGSLIGIRVVKGASAERFERRRYSRIMRRLVFEQLRMSRIDAFSEPTIETLTLFVVGAIILVASHMVLRSKTLEIPGFFVIMACLGGIGDSLRRLSKVNNVLQKSNAAASRIFEVLDLPVERQRALVIAQKVASVQQGQQRRALEVATRPNRVKLPRFSREIRFENITFSYPNANSAAITDLSLTVSKGRSVAVVGRNGSGKTTLLALLPRFYDPQRGRVLLDGVDIKSASLRSLRSQISIVTQDSVIFPGTIAENIAYGHSLAASLAEGAKSPAITALRREIEDAARRAFAHEFILEKPHGYDTMLGEMGGQLSGGQKQRVCIARAIFRKAPILVLDEATSQVDAESEHLIQQAIDDLMHDSTGAYSEPPTTFVIAHRFSTILSADTIVVMDRGRIVGQGKHEELLRSCETYVQLYERQLIAAPVG